MFNSSFRPKNYVLGVKNGKTGEIESEVKCRGFFLNGQRAKKELNVETYCEFINALEKGDMSKRKMVPQFQILFHPKSRKMYSKYSLKTFKNSSYEKRIIVVKKGFCIMTVPYGYNAKLLKTVERNMKPLKHSANHNNE